MSDNKGIGRLGEELAAQYLRKNGFQILHKNFHTRFGELDIVAKKSNKIYFIEVKTRSSNQFGKPHEAVTFRKIEHLKKACDLYLLQNKVKDCKLSLDSISILLGQDNLVKELKYFENVFGY